MKGNVYLIVSYLLDMLFVFALGMKVAGASISWVLVLSPLVADGFLSAFIYGKEVKKLLTPVIFDDNIEDEE